MGLFPMTKIRNMSQMIMDGPRGTAGMSGRSPVLGVRQ